MIMSIPRTCANCGWWGCFDVGESEESEKYSVGLCFCDDCPAYITGHDVCCDFWEDESKEEPDVGDI